MRKLFALAGILALGLFSVNAYADDYAFGFSNFTGGNNLTINGAAYYNTDSGWIQSTGEHDGGNPNYVSGDLGGVAYNDYFSFDLSSLTGSVTSASFNVYTYEISDPGSYDIYATSLTPAEVNSGNSFTSTAFFNDLTSGPAIGSIDLTPGESNTNVTIDLNAAGMTWLADNAGGEVVLGGAFNYTPPPPVVPEPSSLFLLGSGIAGLAGMLRRRIAISL
jgi:hypothetical protein